MKKYINFNYKIDSSYLERAKMIKTIGFDGVFIYSQYNPRNYIEYILSSGLEIETLHLPYKRVFNGKTIDSRYVNILWEAPELSLNYKEELLAQVQFAKEYNIKTLVMHITGGDMPPAYGKDGLNFIRSILSACEDSGITLCLENLRRLDYLEYVFSNIESNFLKFCFDTGHANVMTHNVDTFNWDTFGDKLYCLHLNDNCGERDQHLIPLSGNIKWVQLMKKIKELNPNINYTLEVRATEEQKNLLTEKAFLEQCFRSLIELEQQR